MSCDELLSRLAEFEDDALPPALCEEVRRHLRECSACGELERDLRDLGRLCRECDPPRLPDELRRRLATRLRGEARP